MSPIINNLKRNLVKVSKDSVIEVGLADLRTLSEKVAEEISTGLFLIPDNNGSFVAIWAVEIISRGYEPKDTFEIFMKIEKQASILSVIVFEMADILSINQAKDLLYQSRMDVMIILDHGEPTGFLFEGNRAINESEKANQDNLVDEHEQAAEINPPSIRKPGQYPQRYTNVSLTHAEGEGVVSPKVNLAIGTWYKLRLNIGELSKESVVKNAKERPIRVDLLKPQKGGHWLQAVVVSDVFIVPKQQFDFFLPNDGNSWVCDCPHDRKDPDHWVNCQDFRREYLYIQVQSPNKPGKAELRLGIYFENNLVESQLLTAHIALKEEPGEGYASYIDFSLVPPLDDVAFLPSRTSNILTNHNSDGTHRFVFSGMKDKVISITISEGTMKTAILAARQCLRDLTPIDLNSNQEWTSRTDNHPGGTTLKDRIIQIWEHGLMGGSPEYGSGSTFSNERSKNIFISNLKKAAIQGCYLYTQLVQSNSAFENEIFHEHFQKPGIIQVARTGSSNFVFPWALVYDIHLETSCPQKFSLCRLVEQQDKLKDTFWKNNSRECPFLYEHQRNTLCPFGFWGFRHIIEQPPSVLDFEDNKLCLRIPQQAPLQVFVVISTKLNKEITANHIANMKQALTSFQIEPFEKREALKQRLEDQDTEILYFYCHGKEIHSPSGQIIPYLEFGEHETIQPPDILEWKAGIQKHWKDVPPLVFINGCHTADITPESLVDFVSIFNQAHAAGIIGTEIRMDQRTASEAAERFFTYFGQQYTAGQALKEMRMDILAKRSLLGLAYTAYCSADLILS